MRLIRVMAALSIFVTAAFAHASSVGASHDYNQIQSFLASLAQQHPRNAQLIELGQNTQGETIVGLKIGNGPIKNLIVGTHHGNEYGSTEVALGAAADFARQPITGRTIYVIPVLNISGYNANRREESLDDRYNYSADPNRDYPGPCGTGGPYRLKSTKALADFIAQENIVSLATLHASGNMILLPWGISTNDTRTTHEKEFVELGRMCAAYSDYEVGNSTELLYPADGAFEDYAFWKHGIWSILFEIGSRKTPNEAELEDLVRENVPGLRKFMEGAPVARAMHHQFTGRCDLRLMRLDLRDE